MWKIQPDAGQPKPEGNSETAKGSVAFVCKGIQGTVSVSKGNSALVWP
jgi:hypothetical protein